MTQNMQAVTATVINDFMNVILPFSRLPLVTSLDVYNYTTAVTLR